jgi:hypothetical protein
MRVPEHSNTMGGLLHMRLVDLIREETGVNFAEMALLRRYNSAQRLRQLGGSIEEFTYHQPKGTKWGGCS